MLRQLPITTSRTRLLTGVTAATTATGCAYTYYQSERFDGIRRQSHFWSRILPIAFDYYWRTGASSPYVRYIRPDALTKEQRTEELQRLHEKHAPTVLQTMLDLKGLYVKLGQVLSVTALPVPEAYRVRFRTLQSDVPGWEEFDRSIKAVVEEDLGRPIDDLFESFDPVPCGAASIGQAHRATVRLPSSSALQHVVVKVQYPSARWMIPADIQCVQDLLHLLILLDAVEPDAATLSFSEFSRQFLSELDYERERENLAEVHESSLEKDGPYRKWGVMVPKIYPELCGTRVVTMEFVPGKKFEEEAKRQLKLLGVDVEKGVGEVVREAAKEAAMVVQDGEGANEQSTLRRRGTEKSLATVAVPMGSSSHSVPSPSSWKVWASELLTNVLGVDSLLWFVRIYRRLVLWQTMSTVSTIQTLTSSSVTKSVVPKSWEEWAEAHQTATKQAKRLKLTESWIHALFDVHGHQIFNLGLFNADPHPGNILIIEEDEDNQTQHQSQQGKIKLPVSSPHRICPNPQLGLIDYGQCKRLTPQERVSVARLVLSVANDLPDHEIASAFRNLGIRTTNDSTEFLAKFAKLMFGKLKPEHLSHKWHTRLHEMDKILYFPNELSMVYRTSLLLRGLGMSLQVNCSVGEEWKKHAQDSIDQYVNGVEKNNDINKS